MSELDSLIVPEIVTADAQAFEIVRIWVANRQQYFSLRTSVWEDPAAWGILLADLARHISETYRQEDGRDIMETLDRIIAGFKAELG